MDVTQTSTAPRISFKLDFIVIGNQNAGKTSLIKSFSAGDGTNNRFKVRSLQPLVHPHDRHEPGQEDNQHRRTANQPVHLGYGRTGEILRSDQSLL